MQPITIIQDPTRSAQSMLAKISRTSHVNHAIGSISELALLKHWAMLLTTWCLWTIRNLLFHLLLL
jgi:hypothetical protein